MLIHHLNTEHPNLSLPCTLCEKIFHSETLLRSHKKIHKLGLKQTDTASDIQSHEDVVTPPDIMDEFDDTEAEGSVATSGMEVSATEESTDTSRTNAIDILDASPTGELADISRTNASDIDDASPTGKSADISSTNASDIVEAFTIQETPIVSISSSSMETPEPPANESPRSPQPRASRGPLSQTVLLTPALVRPILTPFMPPPPSPPPPGTSKSPVFECAKCHKKFRTSLRHINHAMQCSPGTALLHGPGRRLVKLEPGLGRGRSRNIRLQEMKVNWRDALQGRER